MSHQNELSLISESVCLKICNLKQNVHIFNIPYRHLILDNAFPDDFLEECLSEFPVPTDSSWERSSDLGIEVKLRSQWKSEFDIPAKIVDLVRILNCRPILDAVSGQIGIKRLIPDAYFTGGG